MGARRHFGRGFNGLASCSRLCRRQERYRGNELQREILSDPLIYCVRYKLQRRLDSLFVTVTMPEREIRFVCVFHLFVKKLQGEILVFASSCYKASTWDWALCVLLL